MTLFISMKNKWKPLKTYKEEQNGSSIRHVNCNEYSVK